MKLQCNFKRLLIKILMYMFVILLTLDCRSIWLHIVNTPSYANVLMSLMIVALALTLIILKGSITHKSIVNAVLFAAGFSAYLAVYFVMRPYNTEHFLRIFMTVFALGIFCIMYCDENTYMDIFKMYRNIILFIAFTSLFFWFFGSVLNIIHPTGYIYSTWTSSKRLTVVTNYYNIYCNTQKILIGGNYVCRNTAIFTEAPMSSFHFSLAFLIEFFLLKDRKKWRYLVLLLAILSTFSLTGYLVILFSLFGKSYQLYKQMKNSNKRYITFLLPILLIFVIFIFFFSVQSQISKYQSNSESFSSIKSLMLYIDAWKQYPIFGYGFEYSADDAIGGTTLVRTNSVLYIIIQGGLYYMSLYVYLFASGFKKCYFNKDIGKFVFLLILLFMVSITIVNEKYIIFLMLFYFSFGVKKTHLCAVPKR